jgi:hypothetical protein
MTNEQTTGDDGKATFQLEYGDYTATITKDGYVTKTENIAFRSNHKNFNITLEESEPTSDVPFTVASHLGAVMVGATMTIKATQDGEVLQTVITDEEGKGTFKDIPYESPYTTYYVDGKSSDETLYNNNMSTIVKEDTGTSVYNYILHP